MREWVMVFLLLAFLLAAVSIGSWADTVDFSGTEAVPRRGFVETETMELDKEIWQ